MIKQKKGNTTYSPARVHAQMGARHMGATLRQSLETQYCTFKFHVCLKSRKVSLYNGNNPLMVGLCHYQERDSSVTCYFCVFLVVCLFVS